ncbi:hypothetical protein A1O3_04869 [Capronia epimyces CBS 606.96]|uniref:Apoptosis regulator Bcl-2 family BH4 domain-containing protein n=1 Tax=Capronia epimyces CBS 606.96 TaxID=1182542 RepID=W9XUE9_9EURO|nr:uncharacterized protein A1O3_04869 [Capronia epimyces CBS 606.96]EXJ84202.1 hypothetical protein A1O3_04869 [Capronia epimyces CBS 606.96]
MEPPPPPDHFGPVDPHTHPMDGVVDDGYEPPVEYEERRPSVHQRISEMSLHDNFQELHPRVEHQRGFVTPAITQDYLYYRFNKNGEDWSSAIKTTISAPIEQIEKKARKGKGDGIALEQLIRMSQFRRDQIEEAVRKANAHEAGEAHWEVAYIKSKKVLKRNHTIVVPEMDVILARTKKPRARARPISGEVVNVINQGKQASDKAAKYSEDGYNRPRKDAGLALLVDPIANLPLFDLDGTPRDELGPIHFNNAGLPPQIPREKPLGAKLERMEEDKGGKRDKSQKRSKSRDKSHSHEDGIFAVGAGGEFGDGLDPPPAEVMFGEVAPDKRGRRGKSPHEHPEVVGGDASRSYSRRRAQAEARGQSREKSRSRRGSVHFPHPHTQQFFDVASSSSEASESSHYGFDYAESSNTSIGSPGGVPRRGSLVRPQAHPDTVYKKHHRGPTRSMSYADKPYHGEQHIITPARSHRNSYILYERPIEGARYERPPRPVRQMTMPILEGRQIVYPDPPQPARSQEVVAVHRVSDVPLTRYVSAESGLPILHYPDEDGDFYFRDDIDRQSSRVEDYQRERVREDFLKQREQEVHARERELAFREEELQRLRRQPEKEYYDDRVRRERRGSRTFYY